MKRVTTLSAVAAALRFGCQEPDGLVTSDASLAAASTLKALNARSHSDQGLSPLTEYCCRVRAVRLSVGSTTYSVFSKTVCATTLALSVAPIGESWAHTASSANGTTTNSTLPMKVAGPP